jgi:hypothetical protein
MLVEPVPPAAFAVVMKDEILFGVMMHDVVQHP